MPRSLLQQIFRSQDGISQQQTPVQHAPKPAPMAPRQPMRSRINSMMQEELQAPAGLGVEFVEEPTFQHRPTVTQRQMENHMASAHVAADETSELIHRLTLEVTRMKKQIQELESKAQTAEMRYNETVQSQKKIYDRVQSALQLFDERIKSVVQDLASRFSVLRGKMTEQKGYETKVEELLSRHNTLVHNFEHRMDNMQKIVKDQEMQLMTFKSLFKQLTSQKK